MTRCPWVDLTKPDYVHYHDTEWGVPVVDDRTHFEYLTLESAQAGLSWYTILKRREGYRKAFAQFNVEQVAKFDEKNIQRLLKNSDIIRNQLKVRAAINNAQMFIKVAEKYGSFNNFIWQFVDGKTIVNYPSSASDYNATSKESDAFSKSLKQYGFKFVGSTICYAHMQAAGLIDDHSVDCFCKKTQADTK